MEYMYSCVQSLSKLQYLHTPNPKLSCQLSRYLFGGLPVGLLSCSFSFRDSLASQWFVILVTYFFHPWPSHFITCFSFQLVSPKKSVQLLWFWVVVMGDIRSSSYTRLHDLQSRLLSYYVFQKSLWGRFLICLFPRFYIAQIIKVYNLFNRTIRYL